MTRDEIVELMARGVAEDQSIPPGLVLDWQEFAEEARAALAALEAAGLVVVPKAREAALVEASRRALNYLENTESELGITLDSADALRAAIAAAKGDAP